MPTLNFKVPKLSPAKPVTIFIKLASTAIETENFEQRRAASRKKALYLSDKHFSVKRKLMRQEP